MGRCWSLAGDTHPKQWELHEVYRKEQKYLDKNPLHLKSTWARPPIHGQSYLEKLPTSPDNPVRVTKPSLLLLLLQQAIKSLEGSLVFRKLVFWHFLAINPCRKLTGSGNLHQNSLLSILFNLFYHSTDMRHFEARWTRITENDTVFSSKMLVFSACFRPQSCGMTKQLSAWNWM